jgi:hypothetical protein
MNDSRHTHSIKDDNGFLSEISESRHQYSKKQSSGFDSELNGNCHQYKSHHRNPIESATHTSLSNEEKYHDYRRNNNESETVRSQGSYLTKIPSIITKSSSEETMYTQRTNNTKESRLSHILNRRNKDKDHSRQTSDIHKTKESASSLKKFAELSPWL